VPWHVPRRCIMISASILQARQASGKGADASAVWGYTNLFSGNSLSLEFSYANARKRNFRQSYKAAFQTLQFHCCKFAKFKFMSLTTNRPPRASNSLAPLLAKDHPPWTTLSVYFTQTPLLPSYRTQVHRTSRKHTRPSHSPWALLNVFVLLSAWILRIFRLARALYTQ
jgi:hypothetical protein